MSDFDGTPFMMGSVIGERSWKYENGLISPQLAVPWTSGVNEHECKIDNGRYSVKDVNGAIENFIGPEGDLLEAHIDTEHDSNTGPGWRSYSTLTITYVVARESAKIVSDHQAFRFEGDTATISFADEFNSFMEQWCPPRDPKPHSIAECTCGFYGYTYGSNQYHRDDGVTGIIEGFGEVLVGTKGFRCTKAKVLALWTDDDWTRARLAETFLGVGIFWDLEQMRNAYPTTRVEDFAE